MKDSKPAFLGGPKSVKTVLNKFNTIGLEEERAVKEVIKTGVLSQYLGCWDKDFFGGPKVKLFEKSCCKYFGVKYSIAVNSGLQDLYAQ